MTTACPKCQGTGLLPAKRKDGTIIPFAFARCSCHPVYGDNPEPERYRDLQPADFDFPMSSDFRSYSYHYCNQPDPGYIPPAPEAVLAKEIFHYHVDLSKKILLDLEGQLKYLQGKITEREKKKRKQEPQKYTFTEGAIDNHELKD